MGPLHLPLIDHGHCSRTEYRLPQRLLGSCQKLLDSLDATAIADAPIVADALSYFMGRKGKLLRPIVTLLCCEVTGGNPMDAVQLAVVVELVHCSSVILDDLPCMDNSASRRGQASLHTRFGEAVAILTSVHLLSSAFRIAAAASKTMGEDLVAMLSDAISKNGMIRGQASDLSGWGAWTKCGL